jgi:hypothetical protein
LSEDIDVLKLVSLILPLALATPAVAQSVICLERQSGQVDGQATQAFADMQARTTPDLAQAMAGNWYSENTSPQTGQISRLYLSYGANGSLSYQNQVCDSSGACNSYQGSGAWAAMPMGGTAFSGIQMISDQGRNQECTGFSGQFVDRNTIQSGAGGMMRRVQ